MLTPRAEAPEGRMGPGVPQKSFTGAVWGTFAFASLFLLVRLYSRFCGPRRLYLDDGLVLAAYALSLAVAILWQCVGPDMYFVLGVVAATASTDLPAESQTDAPPSPEMLALAAKVTDAQVRWLRVSLAAELFFYTGLTLVKFAFLFFFRRLGSRVEKLRYLWWPNVVFTLCIYFVYIGTVDYGCLVGPIDEINAKCDKKAAIDFSTATLQANAVLDVVSDLFIMVIPFTLLWDIRMKWPRKLAFMALFSLSVVTMAIAIVRAVDITRTQWDNGQNDPTYLWLWSAVEANIAIAVSCLSAFPQLFAQSSRTTKPEFSPSDTYRRMISRIRSREKNGSGRSDTLMDISAISMTDHRTGYVAVDDPEVASQSSQRPVLSPIPPARSTVVYNGPSDASKLGPQNAIMQERGVHITRQSNT